MIVRKDQARRSDPKTMSTDTHRRLKLGVGILVLILNTMTLVPRTLGAAWRGAGDFKHFYVGARLVRDNAEFDLPSVFRLQTEIFGRPDLYALPVRLPFYYEILSPLGQLSYGAAHHFWLMLVAIAAVVAIGIYPCGNRWELVAVSVASLPLLYSIVEGQDVAIMLLILAFGLRLESAGKSFMSGLVLSLLSIKFNLFLTLPLVFLIRRNWALLCSAAVGSAALISWSFLLGGWDWPRAFLGIIFNPIGNSGPAIMPNFSAIAARSSGPILVESVLALLAIGAIVVVSIRSRFETAIAAALLGGILVSHHCYAADCAVLIPGLLHLWRESSPIASTGAVIALMPPAYFLAAYENLGVVPAVLFGVILMSVALGTFFSEPERVA